MRARLIARRATASPKALQPDTAQFVAVEVASPAPPRRRRIRPPMWATTRKNERTQPVSDVAISIVPKPPRRKPAVRWVQIVKRGAGIEPDYYFRKKGK